MASFKEIFDFAFETAVKIGEELGFDQTKDKFFQHGVAAQIACAVYEGDESIRHCDLTIYSAYLEAGYSR